MLRQQQRGIIGGLNPRNPQESLQENDQVEEQGFVSVPVREVARNIMTPRQEGINVTNAFDILLHGGNHSNIFPIE